MNASILISTVGSSMLFNIRTSSGEQFADLRRFAADRQWDQTARALRKVDPDDRICGAEINSVHELLHSVQSVALHFLVSDTEDGEAIGAVLRGYYKTDSCNIHKIIGLNPTDSNRFRRVGLSNLVNTIGDIVKKAGDPKRVALNPLGGYKAEIAVAGLVGQALQIPVYYMFEGANVMVMPPMPISFDDSLYADNADIFEELERCGEIEVGSDEVIDERLLPLLEDERIDGKRYLGLSFIGKIFLDGFRLRNPVVENLPDAPRAAERKPPTFRDDHFPSGFKDYVNDVWTQTPYIKTCHSVDYAGQRSIKHRRFHFRPANREIVGEFNLDNFGARFTVLTEAKTEAERNAVIQDLNERFGR